MSACYCDYEAPAFVRKTIRAAGKAHRCCECGRTIAVGERHTYAAGKWDGTLDTFRRCAHCEAVWQALDERLPCYCWYWGGLYEDAGLPEYLHDLRRAQTGDYFAVMRRIAAARRARTASP